MQTNITASDDPQDEAFILEGLSKHSDPFLGEEPIRLCLVARSADSKIVGGIVGKTGWQYLEVLYLWVAEEHRGLGRASDLMREAEAEALRRGCRHARLDTFSFQAVNFYTRLGYREFGRLPAYSGCFDRHFLYKALSADA
jgi:ribosomal protein S18 acetylase RimI-like enzyme